MNDRVTIYEVSPRDGLQNEPRPIPTPTKIALVDLLTGCGFSHIEVASFVSPKWVPQMADGAAVLAGIARAAGRRLCGADAEPQGLRGGAGGAARRRWRSSPRPRRRFSQRNINCSIAESLARFAPVAEAARGGRDAAARLCLLRDGLPVRGRNRAAGGRTRDRIAFRARLPRGQPRRHDRPRHARFGRRGCCRRCWTSPPPERLAGHFHDTRGRALDNIEVALDYGLRVFDAACGGLGGCPFAPGARGKCRDGTGGCAAGGARLRDRHRPRAAGGSGGFRPRAAERRHEPVRRISTHAGSRLGAAT